MRALVMVVGLVIGIMGFFLFLNPKMMRQYVQFWGKGSNIYIAAVINLVVGVAFLLASKECNLSIVVMIIGALGLVKGAALFIMGPGKLANFMNMWTEKPDAFLQAMSFVMVLFGALVIYAT